MNQIVIMTDTSKEYQIIIPEKSQVNKFPPDLCMAFSSMVVLFELVYKTGNSVG